MGLVHLGGREAIGWEEDGEVLASAGVSREGNRLLIRSLTSRRPRAGEALVRALAEVANAAELVARTSDADVYRACGFQASDDGTWTLQLKAVAAPEAARAFTLAGLEEAVCAAWSAETSDDPATWSPDNPARNQCDVTALLIRELLGGEILIANVIRGGRRIERHAWNRLPSGIPIDLTRSQFRDDEQLGEPQTGEPIALARSPERYALFAARVREALGL